MFEAIIHFTSQVVRDMPELIDGFLMEILIEFLLLSELVHVFISQLFLFDQAFFMLFFQLFIDVVRLIIDLLEDLLFNCESFLLFRVTLLL